jgi:trans-aconitate methyltransferase
VTGIDRQAHWQNVYRHKGEQEVSWTQADPQPSLGLIEKLAGNQRAAIADIGGGASRLVDALLVRGFDAITVLDLSEAALEAAQLRIGAASARVQWVAADVTAWQPPRAFDIWHDRAAFHFLVEAADRDAYLGRLQRGVRPGGHAIIATFALDGPEKCSGLAVQRYSPQSLAETVAGAFDLVEHHLHRHVTPWGALQSFQFSVLRRR